ncbi:hypothetical protein B0O80DRAFT_498832 [Mortierella sp. GBAus27b]|nr:hypothetical protein BGX31_009419 [Mortierella sp. GBA43]KAI8353400.1 hypothetical protein B0O80DRAFT_498832 [Mortierella sp. GBAus27b]
MDTSSPYDDWSRHVHAVITFLKPYFDDWRGYISLVSVFLGIGVLVMEHQVLLRMRMGRWEILGYIVWCLISAVLGPLFDIVVMIGLFLYCRHKSNRLHITNESIAKALLPAPVARNYRFMGGVCITASALTLTSNVLYMLRGWKEPTQYFDWASNIVRWMTGQIWYAIGMIVLFHVVTRPAQSGVVLFGKFPRDLWGYKWYMCILYIPVRYILLEMCDVHKDTKEILIPLEIVVDVVLYNGPFLVVLLRLLYLAWKVAYDEAVLTGAIFDDDGSGNSPMSSGRSSRRGTSSRSGQSGGEYVGLAMTDLDEAERGHGNGVAGENDTSASPKKAKQGVEAEDHGENVHVLGDEDEEEEPQAQTTLLVSSPMARSRSASPARSPARSPVRSPLQPKNSEDTVVFDLDDATANDYGEDANDGQRDHRGRAEEGPLV